MATWSGACAVQAVVRLAWRREALLPNPHTPPADPHCTLNGVPQAEITPSDLCCGGGEMRLAVMRTSVEGVQQKLLCKIETCHSALSADHCV